MRISDWSSDVCSSDLKHGSASLGFPIEEFLAALIFACKAVGAILVPAFDLVKPAGQTIGADVLSRAASRNDEVEPAALVERMARTGRLVGRSGEAEQSRRRFLVEIGRASGRESVCQYV